METTSPTLTFCQKKKKKKKSVLKKTNKILQKTNKQRVQEGELVCTDTTVTLAGCGE